MCTNESTLGAAAACIRTNICWISCARCNRDTRHTRLQLIACQHPALLQGKAYDAKADVWSAGCILHTHANTPPCTAAGQGVRRQGGRLVGGLHPARAGGPQEDLRGAQPGGHVLPHHGVRVPSYKEYILHCSVSAVSVPPFCASSVAPVLDWNGMTCYSLIGMDSQKMQHVTAL
jgi:hypothetical protein